MKHKREPTVRALRDAIAAVIRHNRRLMPAVRAGLSTPRLSRLLDCECNDGHRFIEDMATALKRLPRGAPAAQVPLMEFQASSIALLEALDDMASGAPADLGRPLRHAVNDAMTVEKRLYNFCMGISGASPCISSHTYHHRIDTFVHDLKDSFSEINKALSDIEAEQSRPANRSPHSATSGFTSSDRKMLQRIQRAAVYGVTPDDAQIAGDVRRRQVAFGATLYRPSSKHVKGVSSYVAAKQAIRQFEDAEGAYSSDEIASLAKAIRREYQKPANCSGT